MMAEDLVDIKVDIKAEPLFSSVVPDAPATIGAMKMKKAAVQVSEDEVEADFIMEKREKVGGRVEYKVRWMDECDSTWDTWESAANLDGAMVAQFEEQQVASRSAMAGLAVRVHSGQPTNMPLHGVPAVEGQILRAGARRQPGRAAKQKAVPVIDSSEEDEEDEDEDEEEEEEEEEIGTSSDEENSFDSEVEDDSDVESGAKASQKKRRRTLGKTPARCSRCRFLLCRCFGQHTPRIYLHLHGARSKDGEWRVKPDNWKTMMELPRIGPSGVNPISRNEQAACRPLGNYGGGGPRRLARWSGDPAAVWEEMLLKLVDYKAEQGHCRVPKRYPADPSLGRWVSAQRQHKKRLDADHSSPGTTAERVAKLKAVGFEWSTPNPGRTNHAGWEAMLLRLVDFEAEHGHCRVPAKYPADQKLAGWVMNQRTFKKKLAAGEPNAWITAERVAKLNAIGF